MDNIDDIAKQQSLKKQKQKKLREEQLKIEKEKKYQKDMEIAQEKLKMERKWRMAQRKQREKLYSNRTNDTNINSRYGNNNFYQKRQRVRSLGQQQAMADKRRMAAKNRKLQLLKQQEQKRQAG